MEKFYYSVSIPVPLRKDFTYFSYKNIKTGSRVKVTFNRRKLVGFIYKKTTKPDFKIAEIEEILDEIPVFDNISLKTLNWVSDFYIHSRGEVFSNFIPPKLRKDFYLEAPSKKFVEYKINNKDKCFDLTSHQSKAFKFLKELKGFDPCLFHGVTSSGKTEVYMRLVEEVLTRGEACLILIPEISLTPQLEQRFKRRFGDNIDTYHSRKTAKERLETWKKAQSGELRVLIGTRSSLFVPLQKLTLIIIDEEHDSSFKQQDGVKFSARDVAIKMAQDRKIPIIVASATPSLKMLHLANKGKYKFVSIPKRVNDMDPPKFSILNSHFLDRSSGIDSNLIPLIHKTISKNKKVLIFINRRGYSPVFKCEDCNWNALCNSCNSRLVHHKAIARLKCHRCDTSFGVPSRCPECESNKLHSHGVGTQKIESFLGEEFPNVPMVRLDLDSTRKKGSLEKLLSEINENKKALLIGTQMIAKGHDFSDVELGIVIDADLGLISHELNAVEKLSQLLIQVTGRVGRSGKSKIIVQSDLLDNEYLNILSNGDYLSFSKFLLEEYEAANLPPYSSVAILRASSPSINKNINFLKKAREYLEKETNCECVGPLPDIVSKIRGNFRHSLLLKTKTIPTLHKNTKSLVEGYIEKQKRLNVRWSVDMNPIDYQ